MAASCFLPSLAVKNLFSTATIILKRFLGYAGCYPCLMCSQIVGEWLSSGAGRTGL